MTDLDRIDQILSRLPAEEAEFLSLKLEPPWRRRERRLARRDDAIRTALSILASELNPAAQLAMLMARQAGERWGTTGDHLVVEAVAAVLALNDGVLMSERHIRNVAAGDRTPRK